LSTSNGRDQINKPATPRYRAARTSGHADRNVYSLQLPVLTVHCLFLTVGELLALTVLQCSLRHCVPSSAVREGHVCLPEESWPPLTYIHTDTHSINTQFYYHSVRQTCTYDWTESGTRWSIICHAFCNIQHGAAAFIHCTIAAAEQRCRSCAYLSTAPGRRVGKLRPSSTILTFAA
jgi:hypothetical protein